MDRIVAIGQPLNVGSYRVMEKAGMRYEKEAYYYDRDVLYYAISRAEYQPDASPYILRVH